MATNIVTASRRNSSSDQPLDAHPYRFLPKCMLIDRIERAFLHYHYVTNPGIAQSAMTMARQSVQIMKRTASAFGLTLAVSETPDPLEEAVLGLIEAYFDFFSHTFADFPIFLEEATDDAIESPKANINPLIWSTRITRLISRHPPIFANPTPKVRDILVARMAHVFKEMTARGDERFRFEENATTGDKLRIVLVAINQALTGGGGSETGGGGSDPGSNSRQSATAATATSPQTASLLTALGLTHPVDFTSEAFNTLLQAVESLPAQTELERITDAIFALKKIKLEYAFNRKNSFMIEGRIQALMHLIDRLLALTPDPEETAGPQNLAGSDAPMKSSLDNAQRLLTEIAKLDNSLANDLESHTVAGAFLSEEQKMQAIEHKSNQIMNALMIFSHDGTEDETTLRKRREQFISTFGGEVAQGTTYLDKVDKLDRELAELNDAPILGDQTTEFRKRMVQLKSKQKQLYDTVSAMLAHIAQYKERKEAISHLSFSSNIQGPVEKIKTVVENEAKDIAQLQAVVRFLEQNKTNILRALTKTQAQLLTAVINSTFSAVIILPDKSVVDARHLSSNITTEEVS